MLEKSIQAATEKISGWADRWKLQLNADKCSSTLFTTDNRESQWKAKIKIEDKDIKHEDHPTFLGIKYDRTLSFNAHSNTIATKIKKRTNIIRRLANTDWGFEFLNLRASYIALCRSSIEYAAAGWAPWITKSTMERLEEAQRYGARAITGLLKTTPKEVLLIESNLPSITTRLRQLSIQAYDKAKRLPMDNQRTAASEQNITRRTKKTDWRNMAQAEWTNIFQANNNELSMIPGPRPPWECKIKTTFHMAIERKSENIRTNRQAAVQAIQALEQDTDITVYTDGSARDSNKDGGAGIHFERDDQLRDIACPAGRYTSSFQAEMKALQIALHTVTQANHLHNKSILFITDSQSSWNKIRQLHKGQKAKTDVENDIAQSLVKAATTLKEIKILWSPSHCEIMGNDIADDLANEGSQMNQENTTWSYETSKARIRRATNQARIHNNDKDLVYGKEDGSTRFSQHRNTNRFEQVLSSTMRSGHQPDLLAWRHKMGFEDTATCHMDPETKTHDLLCTPSTARNQPKQPL